MYWQSTQRTLRAITRDPKRREPVSVRLSHFGADGACPIWTARNAARTSASAPHQARRVNLWRFLWRKGFWSLRNLVGVAGFEPATPTPERGALPFRRQLSDIARLARKEFSQIGNFVGGNLGQEFCLKINALPTWRPTVNHLQWWALQGLNLRPFPCERNGIA
jgi:hypothetical protein